MKICYVADATHTSNKRWLEFFANRGHDVRLITPRKGLEFRNCKVDIITPLKNRYINFLYNTYRVRKLVQKIKPDILHAHYATDCGFWAAMSGFRPLVINPMGGEFDTQLDLKKLFGILKIPIRYALEHADLVHAADPTIKKRIAEFDRKNNIKSFPYMGVET
jgi:hypothetical protein